MACRNPADIEEIFVVASGVSAHVEDRVEVNKLCIKLVALAAVISPDGCRLLVKLPYAALDYLNILFELLNYLLNGTDSLRNMQTLKIQPCKDTVHLIDTVSRRTVQTPVVRSVT